MQKSKIKNLEEKYIRKVQTSVTNFLFCGEDYLFLKRNKNKRVDPGRLNGIGGRVDPKEDYLSALIRETKEETGYAIEPHQIQLSGIVRLEGGYTEDWIMCFFKTKVESKKIPHGNQVEDGELVWLHKDKVLDSDYELVDDLYYCFKDIVSGEHIFFINAQVGKDEKIYDLNMTKLERKIEL